MVIKIYCVVKDDSGVITEVGILSDDGKTFTRESKSSLIKRVLKLRKEGNSVDIVTSKDNKNVTIVGGEYLRTDGDQNKKNDLLDLIDCPIRK